MERPAVKRGRVVVNRVYDEFGTRHPRNFDFRWGNFTFPIEFSPEDLVGACARQNSLPGTADSAQRFHPPEVGIAVAFWTWPF
jgi:hypothetical protein